MLLWNTPALADDIAAGRVSGADKAAYYVVGPVLYTGVAFGSLFAFGGRSWFLAYEALVVCVIAFVGARRVASTYERPLDGAFFEAVYLLSIPLFIKATLAIWLFTYGIWWVIVTVVPQLHFQSRDWGDVVSYWVNTAAILLPFLFVAAICIVFWLRLAYHVHYISSNRGA